MSPLLSRFRPERRCWDASAPSLLTGGEGLFRDHRNFPNVISSSKRGDLSSGNGFTSANDQHEPPLGIRIATKIFTTDATEPFLFYAPPHPEAYCATIGARGSGGAAEAMLREKFSVPLN